MLDLTNHFGIDVKRKFLDWFHGDFAKEFAERFPGKGITLVILDPDNLFQASLDWHTPLAHEILVGVLGDLKASNEPGGTYNNVAGKLTYVLRTGSYESLDAETNYAMLRPGDFPWQGAGLYEEFPGGVSGLDKEDDWTVYCECIDKLRELLDAVGKKAMEVADELRGTEGASVGFKYLNRIVLRDEDVWPPAAEDQANSSDEPT
jgi:hypothetical protein